MGLRAPDIAQWLAYRLGRMSPQIGLDHLGDHLIKRNSWLPAENGTCLCGITARWIIGVNVSDLQFSVDRSKALATSGGVSWVDPFVGLRVRHRLAPRQDLQAQADIGGFGLGSRISLAGTRHLQLPFRLYGQRRVGRRHRLSRALRRLCPGFGQHTVPDQYAAARPSDRGERAILAAPCRYSSKRPALARRG